jgi:UDP-2,3-diacylglucosamine hydrolase
VTPTTALPRFEELQAPGSWRTIDFISDLHLQAAEPETFDAWRRYMSQTPADAVFILGDLFEVWVGDDMAQEPGFTADCAAVLQATAGRSALFFMHGNRDFLVGERFCAATGARLLDDPTVVELGGEKTLLMHGDTLCTDDLDYQGWRRTARSPAWQQAFLAKSLDERRIAVGGMREKSKEVVQAKSAEIMDVNEGAVREAMQRHGVKRLIHGHTHRPGRHRVALDDGSGERWVLPDWYGHGGYLSVSGKKPKLVQF